MPLVLEKPTDQLTYYSDRTWEQFKLMQQALDESPGLRMAYFEGTIEVFMPGCAHEIFRKIIACLLEAFFIEFQIQVIPTGSFTQEKAERVSVEADESYCIGKVKPIPDLSIEVVFTSGGPSKLDRYQALGVPEVWFWEDGTLTLYRLREKEYEIIPQSEIPELQMLDLNLFTQCILMGETDWLGAMNRFKQSLKH